LIIVKISIRKTMLAVMICSMLALAACQGNAQAAQASKAPLPAAAATQAPTAPAANDPSTSTSSSLNVMQLLFGTLKLKGTARELTAAQAAALLPLWTNYQSLTAGMNPGKGQAQTTDQTQATTAAPQDNSAAQTQLDDLIKQIQAVLTEDQVSAIQAMQITQDSLPTLMKELGITMQTPGQNADGTQPQGGGPDNGGTSPNNGGTPPTAAGTPQEGNGQPLARGNKQPAGVIVNPEVVKALIQYLTSLAGS